MTDQRFSLTGRLRSFHYAFKGLKFVVATQHNAWIHLCISLIVGAFAWLLPVNALDLRWLITAIVLVWAFEIMNTAFEFLCDAVSPEFHASVEKAKDIAAAAVLVAAVGAGVIGALVFWPYVLPAWSMLHR